MRRVALGLIITLGLSACSVAGGPGAAPQQVQVVTPLPAEARAGVGYQLYAPRPDLRINGRSAVDTFGVTGLVVLPDGTVFALQDSRVSVGDSDDHEDSDGDWGRALVTISPAGRAGLVDSPYADRERGRDVWPLCAAPEGDLYALDDDSDYRLVARDPSGTWREVTAAASSAGHSLTSSGDGGPATQATLGLVWACAVGVDGGVYLAEDCLLRRIDPSGTIAVVAGRRDRGSDRGAGCGAVDSDNRSDPPTTPAPSYDGPGRQAELGEVSALAADPDGAIWLSALRGLQRLGRDGHLESVPIPAYLDGPYAIRGLATLPDSTVLALYGLVCATGIAARDPATGSWRVLVAPEASSDGSPAPAPLAALALCGGRLSTSADRLYVANLAGASAGIVVIPWT